MRRLIFPVGFVFVAWTCAMCCRPFGGLAAGVSGRGKANQPKDQRPHIPFANWATLATDRSPTARRAAARILGNYPRRGMPYLLKLLGDRDARVRLEALRSIEAVISGISIVAVYGGDDPSIVLGPVSGLRRGPAWSGKFYQNIVGRHAEQVRRGLRKLQRGRPELRTLAAEAMHELDVRLAAAAVALKQGRGKAVRQHPNGKVTVKGDELTDRQGKVLARLSRGSHEEVACWAFSPDGRLLAVGIRYDTLTNSPTDGTIAGGLRLYDAATGELLGEAGSVFGPVEHLAFSADGKTLLYQTGKYQEKGGK